MALQVQNMKLLIKIQGKDALCCHAIFKTYTDTAMDEWPSWIRTHLKIGQWILNTLLLTDYQTVSGQTKYNLQSATQLLHNILQKHDLEKSIKMYVMAFQGTYHTWHKIVINNHNWQEGKI